MELFQSRRVHPVKTENDQLSREKSVECPTMGYTFNQCLFMSFQQ